LHRLPTQSVEDLTMNTRHRLATLTLAALLALPGLHAAAQEKVMREGQVTQQGLIEALLPPAPAAAAAPAEAAAESPDAAASGPRTRSFRPGVRPAAAVGATSAAGTMAASQSGRASILFSFVTGSAELTGQARSALDVLAGAMKSERLTGARFSVEGHADPRGSDELNQRLSAARAEAVREYLVGKHGLAADRLEAVGRGSSQLLNKDDPAAAENRRVTIVTKTQ
jgi:OmpA-OmpF porin, OOP family